MLDGEKDREGIDAHRLHECLGVRIRDEVHRDDAGIREKDVEPAVRRRRMLDARDERRLVCGVKLTHLDRRRRVPLPQFILEGREIRRLIVAEVDDPRAPCAKELGRRGTNPNHRVCARDDADAVLERRRRCALQVPCDDL